MSRPWRWRWRRISTTGWSVPGLRQHALAKPSRIARWRPARPESRQTKTAGVLETSEVYRVVSEGDPATDQRSAAKVRGCAGRCEERVPRLEETPILRDWPLRSRPPRGLPGEANKPRVPREQLRRAEGCPSRSSALTRTREAVPRDPGGEFSAPSVRRFSNSRTLRTHRKAVRRVLTRRPTGSELLVAPPPLNAAVADVLAFGARAGKGGRAGDWDSALRIRGGRLPTCPTFTPRAQRRRH
jgi:hypothetical protein